MNTVHVCVAADGNYKLPLLCLVKSIALNSASHPCVIHVLQGCDFIDMSKYVFDFSGLDMQHWTRAIFYRMMIPEIFKNLDRILYIDCDTLVLSDLFDFFNTEFTADTDIAMVVDKFSWKSQIVKLKTKNYFNSGMILFDINKCRESEFSKKCRKNIRQALNKGASYRITYQPESLADFQKVYYSTMERNAASEYYFFDDEYLRREHPACE